MTRAHYDNLCRVIPFDGGVRPDGVIRVIDMNFDSVPSWPIDEGVERWRKYGETYLDRKLPLAWSVGADEPVNTRFVPRPRPRP